jgi:hypothetical protein
MDFYDISYLTKYPSVYEASTSQSYGLLARSNAFFSSDNSLSFPYNSSFNSSFDFMLPENAENPQIDALTDRNVYLVWEDNKWSVLYYSSLFIIPAVLTVLYLSPDFMKGLDLSSLFIYLGLIIFALIANNDTRWLLEWAKTVSQNSVSLNAIVNTTVSGLHSDNMKLKNELDSKLMALENELNALKTKVNDIETRTQEAFVEQDKKISIVNAALVSIDTVSQSTGNVMLWSLENLPDGWVRCDGTGGTPNLLDRFVVSAGGEYKLMDSGGNDVIYMTEGQMFPHTHGDGDYNRLLSVASGRLTIKDSVDDSWGEPDLVHSGELRKVGNGDPIDIRPRYAALYFICKNRIT